MIDAATKDKMEECRAVLQDPNSSLRASKYYIVRDITEPLKHTDNYSNCLDELLKIIADSTPLDFMNHYGELEQNSKKEYVFRSLNGIQTIGETAQAAFLKYLSIDYNSFLKKYDQDAELISSAAAKGQQLIRDQEEPQDLTSQELDSIISTVDSISVDDLMQMDIPPLRWAVNKLLPCGMGFLCAPPKYYKSFLALQVCIAICNGEKLFDQDTNKTECLYFDLESTERRPRERIKLMAGVDQPKGLYIYTDKQLTELAHKIPELKGKRITLANCFDKVLLNQLNKHPKVGFVVIDVFQKIRSMQGKTQSAYDHDYQDIDILQKIAAEKNISILLVHHSRKMKDSSDAFNNMSGSTAILGASDYSWVIDKENRTDENATLHITGRDIESQELAIEFNKDHFRWHCLGTADEIQTQKELDEYNRSAVIATIKKLVSQNGGTWSGSVTEIINASKYFNTPIYEKAQQVGSSIQRYSSFLAGIDHITYDYQRKEHGRIYIFTANK